MIQLYDDQEETVERIREAYRNRLRAPLLVAPTGFGKTVVFSYIARSHVEKGGRVLILTHREELLEQVSDTLKEFNVSHGIISPAHPHERNQRVQVASVFALANRLGTTFRPTLIIVDEAHHCTDFTSIGKILRYFRKAHFLGVTATPFRLSGEGLSDYFNVLVQGPSVQQLIDAGRLSPFRVFCPSAPDLSSVQSKTGDFMLRQLATAVDHPAITEDALVNYQRHADGKRGVAFCVSVPHARNVAERFQRAGYPAMAIDGKMEKDARKAAIADFRRGALKILTSCELISEGFNVPDIEVGISLRPTMSLGLWLQQFGRCLRTCPGKSEAIMLDLAGNALRHGLPTDHREYTLRGLRSRGRVAGLKICQECFAAHPESLQTCSDCGAVLPLRQSYRSFVRQRKVTKSSGQLQDLAARFAMAHAASKAARQERAREQRNVLETVRSLDGQGGVVYSLEKARQARQARLASDGSMRKRV